MCFGKFKCSKSVLSVSPYCGNLRAFSKRYGDGDSHISNSFVFYLFLVVVICGKELSFARVLKDSFYSTQLYSTCLFSTFLVFVLAQCCHFWVLVHVCLLYFNYPYSTLLYSTLHYFTKLKLNYLPFPPPPPYTAPLPFINIYIYVCIFNDSNF